ncbi:imm11 family protein [Pyxidicoccus sp. 3LG]
MQHEYFVLLRARSQQHPLLAWNQSYSAFLKGRPVEVLEPVKLKLGAPVLPKPVMVDHHSLPSPPVVSSRLKDVLEAAQLPGVQFVPADVQVGDEVLRYWLLHMWRRITCVDRERSVLTLYPNGDVLDIGRLVLDEQVLRELPLQQRLAFELEEDIVHIFHRTVVDRVMSLTPPPEGLRFVPVPEWNDSAGFR